MRRNKRIDDTYNPAYNKKFVVFKNDTVIAAFDTSSEAQQYIKKNGTGLNYLEM